MTQRLTLDVKINHLRRSIEQQFYSRAVIEGNRRGISCSIKIDTKIKDFALWITFIKGEEKYSLTIPVPFEEKGIVFICDNEVVRAVCPYFVEETQQIFDYIDIMFYIMCGNSEDIIGKTLKKIPYIQQIVYSFDNKNTATIIHNIQRNINEVVNNMPLHKTDMNSAIMNKRLMIIDSKFDTTNPADRLKYQINKNHRYFERGWTSIGMSEGSLSDRNYILTYDIRHLSPFGFTMHNPQRNLYQTLSMKGEELPLIKTRSMKQLEETGIYRTGWNLFTMFVNLPDTFEDQILLDESHANKFITSHRRVQCFGQLFVKEGQKIEKGTTLSMADDGEIKKFDVFNDGAKIKSIKEQIINVGGVETVCYNVIIEFKRQIKDGVKLTNLYANKGVIRLKKLGFAIDPRTGENRKIDVIVAGQAVKRRKNYGQVIEALINNIHGETEVVIDDYAITSTEYIEKALLNAGFPKDGTWVANTYMGQLYGICGTVFWGVTKDVEDQLWEKHDVFKTNVRGLRTAGIKLSTVEIRALTTRFGIDNPIVEEILSHAQGNEEINECIDILKSKIGVLPAALPVVSITKIKTIDQTKGTVIKKSDYSGTIADERFHPNGFVMLLPIIYQITIDENEKVIYEGRPKQHTIEELKKIKKIVAIDRIYVPKEVLRRSWRHEVGKYGISEVVVYLNNIICITHRMWQNPENSINELLLYDSVKNYFKRVAESLGTKKGRISMYGMAVRYPYSAKAVATLKNSLPKNTIEIHRDMAKQIGVKEGNVVIVVRFPCLGFTGTIPQKVKITDDPQCKFTIRVKGNNLVSMGLDFDGDVIYIVAFKTQEANKVLMEEWTNPNETCYEVLKKLNGKNGVPHIKCLSLHDYEIHSFEPLTADTHAEIVAKATGVKSHTGPVIALAYNIMRIVENSKYKNNQKVNVAVEYFLDRVGNSVFSQKHGTKSLHEIVIDAICCGDVESLVTNGFERGTSTIICNIIKEKATKLNIFDLVQYHERIKKTSGSTIINRIVRHENSIYFASRAKLEGNELLHRLNSEVVDIPSSIFKRVTQQRLNNSTLDIFYKALNSIFISNRNMGATG